MHQRLILLGSWSGVAQVKPQGADSGQPNAKAIADQARKGHKAIPTSLRRGNGYFCELFEKPAGEGLSKFLRAATPAIA